MQTFKQDDIENMLREHSLKVTEHRVAILLRIAKSKTPIAAHKLIEDLKNKINIDQATVYRNLQTLEESGTIRRYDYNHGHAHYEISENKMKHQIVCSTCETIENIPALILEDTLKKINRKSKKFKSIDDTTIQIYGVCKSCS